MIYQVYDKTTLSRRGGVLLRPMKITFALSGFNGQSRALPLRDDNQLIMVMTNLSPFCVSNSAWWYSLLFDWTGEEVEMVLPFCLTVKGCPVRSVQLFPDNERILTSVNIPSCQFMAISKLPRAFRPETEPSFHTSGKAGNR